MNDDEITFLTCVQCGKPVSLRIATTDEYGHAVHKECYELRLKAESDARTVKDDIARYSALSNWPDVYTNAMLELEDALLAERIVEAREEIAKRLMELNHLPGLHTAERQAINDALQGLLIVEREDQRYKAAEMGKAALEKISSIARRSTSQESEPD